MSVSLRQIEEAVSRHFALPIGLLRGPSRERRFARPRQVAMYLAREMTPRSYPEIGQHFLRDHTTVLYAHRHIGALMIEEEEIKEAVEAIGLSVAKTPCWRASLREECLAAQAIGLSLRGAIQYAEAA